MFQSRWITSRYGTSGDGLAVLRFAAYEVVRDAGEVVVVGERLVGEQGEIIDVGFPDLPVGRSEIGSGELILFPILREVWKPLRR